MATGSLAGCLDGIGGSDAGNAADRLSAVPSMADAVATVDVNTFLADDGVRTTYDAWLEARAATESYDGPTTLAGTLDDVESTEGFDLRDLSTVTLFVGYDVSDGQVGGVRPGYLLEGSWEESTVLSTVDTDYVDYAEATYADHTVYEPDSEHAQTVGVLEEGRYVVADRGAVEAAIDVDRGETDPIAGPVADAYRGTTAGPVRFASAFQEGWVPDEVDGEDGTIDLSPVAAVETVAGAVYREGTVRGVDVSLHAPDGGTAAELDETVQGLVSLASVRNEATPGYVTDLLADVAVERSGASVTLSVERTVDELAAMATEYGEGSTAAASGGAVDLPRISADWAYDADAGTVTITHAAGDAVPAEKLYVRGEGFADADGADMAAPGRWAGTASGGEVTAGDSVTVGVESDYALRLVWEGEDVSGVLGRHAGPDA